MNTVASETDVWLPTAFSGLTCINSKRQMITTLEDLPQHYVKYETKVL